MFGVATSYHFPASSPVIPVIALWASEHDNRYRGNAWNQWHGVSLTKANLTAVTANWPIYQQQRLTLSSQYGTIPGVINQLPSGWLIALGSLSSEWCNALFLLKYTLTLCTDLPFLHEVLLSKLLSMDLQKVSSTIKIIHKLKWSKNSLHSKLSVAVNEVVSAWVVILHLKQVYIQKS